MILTLVKWRKQWGKKKGSILSDTAEAIIELIHKPGLKKLGSMPRYLANQIDDYT
jgi:hypothetical protein